MKLSIALSIVLNIALGFLIYSWVTDVSEPIAPAGESLAADPSIEIWDVKRVSDGDTIAVTKGGEERKIRFCGIDAPEKAQPGGREAAQFLKDVIAGGGGKVGLTFIERDRYNRHIAEVWSAPGTEAPQLLNSLLIATGHAWHYEQYSDNCPNRSALVASEESADESGRAIWKQSGAIAPWDWRRQKR